MKKSLLFLLLISVSILQAQENQNENSAAMAPQRDISFEYRFSNDLKQTPDSEERLNQWYRDAKFGAFIHFGVYSTLEGQYKGRVSEHRYAEWIQAIIQM